MYGVGAVQIKAGLDSADEDDRRSMAALCDAQTHVERRLERTCLPTFIASADFVARQRPPVTVGHVVDDVIAGRRRRNVHAVQRVRRPARPSLEVAATTLGCCLLIYSFQFTSAFQPRCRNSVT